MAKREHRAGEHRADEVTAKMYDVLLRLRPAPGISDDDLEDLSIRAFEAVESYATSCALGPAVGFTFEPPEIQLAFNVEADTTAEVRELIARVNRIVVNETGVEFELDFETTRGGALVA